MAHYLRRVIPLLISSLILLLFSACSGDNVKVTTRSSTPAIPGESGAGLTVGASSADGSQTVNIGTQGTSTSTTQGTSQGTSQNFQFETARAGIQTFCLELTGETNGTASVQLSQEDVEVLSLQATGCAAAYLEADTYLLEVNTDDETEDAEISLVRVPESEYFSRQARQNLGQGFLTLITVSD